MADSLLVIEQIESTKKLYRELRNYVEEAQNIEEAYSKGLDTIQEFNKNIIAKVEQINNGVISVATQLENINTEFKKDSFKWMEFISSALSELLGAFVGVLAAVHLFFRESKRDKRIKRDEEKRDVDEMMNYFGSLLKSSMNITHTTIKGLEKYSTEMDKNPIIVPSLPINPTQDLERLGELINNEKYYYAYLKKYGSSLENGKNIIELLEQLIS